MSLVIAFTGCDTKSDKARLTQGSHQVSSNASAKQTSLSEDELEGQIESFCGACHGMPRPSSFAKRQWKREIDQGYKLFFKSKRTDLRPPSPKQLVYDYYVERAPEELLIESSTTSDIPFSVGFDRQDIPVLVEGVSLSVSNLRWLTKSYDDAPVSANDGGMLVCDMKRGYVFRANGLRRSSRDLNTVELGLMARYRNVSFIDPTDLDQDGRLDYVIAELGDYLPDDHHRGKVIWLHEDTDGNWQSQTLLYKVGRVASVETADFDGDGAMDIVVAEFGWRETGSLIFLHHQVSDQGNLKFQREVIDERSGAIQVQKCDFNGDGKLDFVTVLSQEHELVVAYLNEGRGQFKPHLIWSAGYPSHGTNGIELVDFDEDGDLDVLCTNGDAFDDYLLKPYFSIQWLENQGSFPFVHHQIAKMQGVHRALPGDFDGDGDLDVVAVSLLPRRIDNKVDVPLDSVILLERDGETFKRHSLESGHMNHATLEVGDFDEDGDLDFATGEFWPDSTERTLSIWWNESEASISLPAKENP
ncbi:FG-GAP repeat domain-containing protein [Rubripirellula amarantea]|nr:VCBS repeat-containing protein [Rubripirellula amarantea]